MMNEEVVEAVDLFYRQRRFPGEKTNCDIGHRVVFGRAFGGMRRQPRKNGEGEEGR